MNDTERLEATRKLVDQLKQGTLHGPIPTQTTMQLVMDADFLLSHLDEVRKRNDEFVEREAAVCPEDVPFDEYIRVLNKKLDRADSLRAQMVQVVEQKRDEWERRRRDLSGDPDVILQLSLKGDVRVANEIITALKAVGREEEGKDG